MWKVLSGLKWPDPWHVLIPAERIRFRNVRWPCSSRGTISFLNASTCWPIYQPSTPEGSDFTDVSRTRDYADRLGLAVESSSIATSGILPGPFASNFAVPPETWIFFPRSFPRFFFANPHLLSLILKSSHSNLWINNLLVYVEKRLCIKTRRYSVLLDASCIEGRSIYPLPEF